MPRFFFNIADHAGWIQDEEGMDLPNLQAAIIEARTSARDFVGLAVKESRAVDDRRILVIDQKGKLVFELPVKEMEEEMKS